MLHKGLCWQWSAFIQKIFQQSFCLYGEGGSCVYNCGPILFYQDALAAPWKAKGD